MKIRIQGLCVAVLLFMSSLVAAQAPADAELAAKVAPAVMSPLAGACANSLAKVSLPDTTPPPIPLFARCGACSDPGCSGGGIGQSCPLGLGRGACRAVAGSTCGGKAKNFRCSC